MKVSPHLIRLVVMGVLIGAVVLLAVGSPAWASDKKIRHSTVPQPADLEIDKSGPGSAKRGDTIEYKIVVENEGPGDAQNVVVTDNLPSQVTFVSASSSCSYAGGTVTCSLGTLKDDKTVTLKIRVKINTSTSASQIVNTAKVTSTTPDKKFSNNTDSATTRVR